MPQLDGLHEEVVMFRKKGKAIWEWLRGLLDSLRNPVPTTRQEDETLNYLLEPMINSHG
jgi:hypothetical protein